MVWIMLRAKRIGWMIWAIFNAHSFVIFEIVRVIHCLNGRVVIRQLALKVLVDVFASLLVF